MRRKRQRKIKLKNDYNIGDFIDSKDGKAIIVAKLIPKDKRRNTWYDSYYFDLGFFIFSELEDKTDIFYGFNIFSKNRNKRSVLTEKTVLLILNKKYDNFEIGAQKDFLYKSEIDPYKAEYKHIYDSDILT